MSTKSFNTTEEFVEWIQSLIAGNYQNDLNLGFRPGHRNDRRYKMDETGEYVRDDDGGPILESDTHTYWIEWWGKGSSWSTPHKQFYIPEELGAFFMNDNIWPLETVPYGNKRAKTLKQILKLIREFHPRWSEIEATLKQSAEDRKLEEQIQLRTRAAAKLAALYQELTEAGKMREAIEARGYDITQLGVLVTLAGEIAGAGNYYPETKKIETVVETAEVTNIAIGTILKSKRSESKYEVVEVNPATNLVKLVEVGVAYSRWTSPESIKKNYVAVI